MTGVLTMPTVVATESALIGKLNALQVTHQGTGFQRSITKFWQISLGIVLCVAAPAVHAQENCRDTAQGRICDTAQPLTSGAVVGTNLERALGLVTVSGGCSGTLLNRWWVLTARHCVTTTETIDGPLHNPNNVTITATWAPGIMARATHIHELAPNRGVENPGRDMILVYFASGDLGPVNRQPIFASEQQAGSNTLFLPRHLKTTDIVTQ